LVIMPVMIDMEKCGKMKECPGEGLCIKICEQEALKEENGELVLYPDKCDDCDLCIQNCPNQAIAKE
jgi:ferredoxin